MSKLDELISKLCPDGVEYKGLKEIFNTRNGYTPSKSNRKFWENGVIPWFRMEDIREKGNILGEASQMVTKEAVKGEPFPANSIIVATSATIGIHALITVPSVANQRFTYLMIKDEYADRFEIKFIYYYCYKLDDFCKACLNQGNFASVDMKKFANFEFPIPPLEVQREIVRILEKYTETSEKLTEELSEVISARKKQYDFYANKLFVSDIPMDNWKTVRDVIVSLKTGLNPRQSFKLNVGGDKAYVTGKDIYNNSINVSEKTDSITDDVVELINKRACLESDDVLFASTGTGTVGRMAVIENYDNSWAVSETMYCLKPQKGIIHPYYLMYALYTQSAREQFEPKISKGSVPHLKVSDLLEVKIPVPEMAEQERIIGLMRRLERLYIDILDGLSEEIIDRKKQYEFYRDRLLTFNGIK